MLLCMALRPPPSLHGEKQRHLSPGELYRVISEGYGLMPAYAAEIAARDRWAVVAYLRALQLSRNVRVDELSPDERARLR